MGFTDEKEVFKFDLDGIPGINSTKQNIFISGKRTKSILKLHRFVELNDCLLRVLYLVYGDGSIHKGILFSNINYRAHKEFIKVFKKSFDIDPKHWKLSLHFNENFSDKAIEKATKFWINLLGIKVNYIYKTKFNTCLQGGAKTFYNNTKLSKVFNSLIYQINLMISNKNLTKRQLCLILDGILNAEGGADIGNTGLHRITISFNKYDKEETILFTNLLKSLGIINNCKIRQERRFEFSRWINHYKFICKFVKESVKPFSLHPKRALNLFNGFLKHERTKSMYRYLSIISKKDRQTFKELNKELNYHPTSIEEALIRKFRKFGFFVLEGKGVNRNPYRVSLTKEGEIFLKVFKKVKIWLKETKIDYEKDIKLLSVLN